MISISFDKCTTFSFGIKLAVKKQKESDGKLRMLQYKAFVTFIECHPSLNQRTRMKTEGALFFYC